MQQKRVNDVYLPGFRLPDNVLVFNSLQESLSDAEVDLSVVPSHLVRSVYEQMLPWLTPGMVFVSATKGLENTSLLRPSEIITEVISTRFIPQVAVLSGPTFAREVAALNPTAIVISSA